MLKIKKIANKETAKIVAQDSQPCAYAGVKRAYNCLYDCKTSQYRYYKSKDL